jgi:glycine/D-amino acid oxidase-like deaminating enzyme
LPRFGTEVARLDGAGDSWTASTRDGELRARQVVVATGYNPAPIAPHWPGQSSFPGEVLHASAYANAATYRDQDVLVVGAGNTGAEIAADLAETGARTAVLADGTRLSPTTVIAATGYTTGLAPVLGHLGVLDDRGRPPANGARAAAPGLRFVGLSTPLKGLLLQINLDARAAARAIARELGR